LVEDGIKGTLIIKGCVVEYVLSSGIIK